MQSCCFVGSAGCALLRRIRVVVVHEMASAAQRPRPIGRCITRIVHMLMLRDKRLCASSALPLFLYGMSCDGSVKTCNLYIPCICINYPHCIYCLPSGNTAVLIYYVLELHHREGTRRPADTLLTLLRKCLSGVHMRIVGGSVLIIYKVYCERAAAASGRGG